MAQQSLAATPEGVEQINRAIIDKEWSREDLAKECDCSKQPPIRFCSGKPVSKKNFVRFCKILELDWETVSGFKAIGTATRLEQTEINVDTTAQGNHQKVQVGGSTLCKNTQAPDIGNLTEVDNIYNSINISKILSDEGLETNEIDKLIGTNDYCSQPSKVILLCKNKADELILSDPSLEAFMNLAAEKSLLVQTPYRNRVNRAFYVALFIDSAADLDSDLYIGPSPFIPVDICLSLDPSFSLKAANELDLDLYLYHCLALYSHLRLQDPVSDSIDESLTYSIENTLKKAGNLSPDLKVELREWNMQIPSHKDWSNFQESWQEYGTAWTERLRAILIKHRAIGHNWNFTGLQRSKLYRFYRINRMILTIIKSGSFVTKSVQEEVKNTLFLPNPKTKQRQVLMQS